MSHPLERHLRLPGRLTSAGEARRFVGEVLRDVGVAGDPADTALLLTSELVTNAVLHAGGSITVGVVAAPQGLRIEVCDPSRTPPIRRAAGTTTSGRGLELVEHLARGWGVAPVDGDGKTVWFEVGTATPPSPGPLGSGG